MKTKKIDGVSEMQFIDFVVFGHTVGVIFATDIRKAMMERHGEKLDDANAATFCYTSKARSELFFPFNAKIRTIAHEAVHAIWNLFDYHGMKRSNEGMAYHIGYLVGEILKCRALALQSKRNYEKKKVKHG